MLLLTTGGTIDKIYNPLTGLMGFGEKTRVPKILEQIGYGGQISLRELMLKDSLEMDDVDRQAVHDACAEDAERRIVITHGTDTMVKTANVLRYSDNRWLAPKTVVLTGAMVPHTVMEPASDAAFNLGQALGYAEQLESGIYVVMSGQLFDAGNVQKDTARGVFERIY